MRCHIINCEHRATKTTKGSWARFGICSCCAYDLFLLNDKKIFFTQSKPTKPCNEPFNPNPFGITTRQAMINQLEIRPMIKEELKLALYTTHRKQISNQTFNLHFFRLQQDNTIKEVNGKFQLLEIIA